MKKINDDFMIDINKTEFSSEIQEVVSWGIPFIVRWGTIILFLILVFIISICSFIKYPDLIKTQAQLTCINAPKTVICNEEGKLVELRVKENQQVIKGEIIGLIESTAKHKEVLNLLADIKKMQNKIKDNNSQDIPLIFTNRYTKLGEIQEVYQGFLQAFLVFKNYLPSGFYSQKKQMLYENMRYLKELHANYKFELKLEREDLNLACKSMKTYDILEQKQLISDEVYRSEKSKYINKQLTIPRIKSTIINNLNSQNNKLKELTELENTISHQKLVFQQELNTLESNIENWKKKYLLLAPAKGNILFADFIQENQQLQRSQTICYVTPNKTDYYAQIVIPQKNLGKVKLNQTVLLKFNSYPYEEYGCLIGKIKFISSIPGENGYSSKVILTNGLITNFNKKIIFRNGLTANAEIVTKDQKLIQRFYQSILGVIN